MVEIDGSYGEGGGQILRTALSLSLILRRPFRMTNIRKNRKNPGLRPQHLTAVRAAALLSGASVEGDSEGSLTLSFRPGEVRAGDYLFDIGTAGSTGLLAQTLLPPLAISGVIDPSLGVIDPSLGAIDPSLKESTLTLKGGTHVPWSPPFHYISEVFLPMLGRLGIDIRASLESCGFYPKGGGKIRFAIRPAGVLRPGEFTRRGRVLRIKGLSAVANLPMSIAERQRRSVLEGLGQLGDIPVDIELMEVPAFGQGTFVFLSAASEGSMAGFSSLGARGKRAETVGEEAARELLDYYRSGACLEPHMADQIVLYLSLARGPSRFTTSAITPHLRTNLWVIEKFVPLRYGLDPSGLVTLEGGPP
jgi:RNA 3'-terminal phosphate cyclase (ATP)